MTKKRCTLEGMGDCQGKLYRAHSYVMLGKKGEPCTMKVEEAIRKLGGKGFYMASFDDPWCREDWACERHFLETEFGLIKVTCPGCLAEFAFSSDNMYEASEILCVRCGRMIFAQSDPFDDVSKDGTPKKYTRKTHKKR